MVDLIILGGGPAGYHAAGLAANGGLKTLLFEKRAVGGVCLNEGCIPSKALLYSAKVYDICNGGGKKYGVTCDNPLLDYAAAVRRKDKVVKKLTAGIEATLKQAGVEIVRETAVIAGRTDGGFEVQAGGTAYQAKALLICTGSEPVLPPVKGAGDAMTNREILSLTQAPETLAVIGGGVIGLEMASLFNSAGSKVTVYEMTDKIAGPFDREISEELQRIYEKKGVVFYLNTAVADVAELGAEKTLVSVGRKPVIDGLGLDAIGVHTERGAVVTDEQMKTSVPGVFAAGDVNGKSMLAHTAYREAEVAVNNIVGAIISRPQMTDCLRAADSRPYVDRMNYSAIPSVIYTNPEAAGIGETLESAKAKGFDARETRLPMQYSGRFMAENEGGTGLCKLVWQDGRLIGAHLLGNPASEIISTLSAILYREMSLEQIKKIVFPHPTVAEIIKEAVFHA
ncbi:MAG: NAD(P)/FAD-dependent oxidoreductase [Oscillospiraceae bacterium]|jgi:dihydrolipoamide dehydrogenase|nr:NAD(P)/FAD-dependent oxidoreductase [Oscillospiraceae bacterium]